MITVRVLAKDGWQNGDTLWPTGKTMSLECDEDTIKAYIDDGTLEIVKAEVINDLADEQAEQKKTDLIVKSVVEAMAKLNVDKTVIKIRDRVEDDEFGGWESFGELGTAIYKADNHDHESMPVVKKLRAWDAQEKTTGHLAEDDDAQGGHLVPVGFVNRLLQTSLESTIVRSRAQFVPCATNAVAFPAISDYDHRQSGNGLFGALVIKRPGEAGLKNPSKPLFDKVQLTLHKMVFLTYVSDELLEDSPISIEPLLNYTFAKGIAWHEDNDFINGTGVNMALGVLNAPALITPTRSTCGAGYLNYVDIVTMWSRLHPASMGTAVWLVNNAVLPYLYQLCYSCTDCTDSVVTGTAAFMPGNGASETPYNTLLGRPVIVTEHCPSLGNIGDIMLADWSQYLVAGKAGQGAKFESSIHLKFDYDEVAFRTVMRVDGKPWWLKPLTPKHTISDLTTTGTLSPFVALTVHPDV